MSTAPAPHGTRASQALGHWPVVIVGGGLVGATLAAALARSDIPVALVEASPAPASDDVERDPRPIALAESSRRILDTLDLWGPLAALATPIRSIHVSDRGHFGFARIHARDAGVEALGHVVEAADVASGVERALAGMSRVHRMRPATVVDASFAGNRVSLVVRPTGEVPSGHARSDGDGALSGDLLVLCDGGRSSLREALGVAVRSHDYRQCAIAARVRPRHGHGFVAYERFTANGPIALLPMTDGCCGLVWSLPAEHARAVAELPEPEFLADLTRSFGRRMGEFLATGPRTLFPLHLVAARAVVRPRLAIVGNAAHHLHPVAGQGFNLGLRDVAALAETVAQSLRTGVDPGGPQSLERYAARRRDDHRRVTRATHALVRLFSNDLAPVVVARNLGLLGLDLLPPLKRRFARRATGLVGPMSRLARGLAP